MEKNKKIEKVEFISKDDKPYVRFVVNTGDSCQEFERPVYNEKGEFDPEVSNLLEIARAIDEKSKLENKIESLQNDIVVADVENDLVEENENTNNDCKAIVPASVGTVTVYNQPDDNANLEKEGFFKRNGRLIAVGLAGILVGVCLTKGCSCVKNDKKANTEIKKDNVIENMEVEKIQYITKEQYETGVKEFCKSLNDNYGFNYQPSQLTSFYYVANMENISEDLFKELVNDGYVPDTVAKLFANVFEVTGSIRTQNLQKGTSKIDYSNLFIDQDAVKIAEDWETKFNNLDKDNNEDAKSVVDELHNFVIVNPESNYNTLPTGTREIFNWTIAESVYTKASFAGVDAEQALKDEIADMTTAMKVYENTFNCLVVEEAEKTLTK